MLNDINKKSANDSEFKNYDIEMKMSVCRAAFELYKDFVPHEDYFHLARQIGYNIPEKLNGLYL